MTSDSEASIHIPVRQFYGRTARKLYFRKRTEVDKEGKDGIDRWKLPTKFPERLLGPTVCWKVFHRQTEAFKFAAKTNEDVRVFAYENPGTNQNCCRGQRLYLVTSLPVFWHFYRQLEPRKKHHYEIIPEGWMCKLYFDLEFKKGPNPHSHGHRMVDLLIQYVAAWVQELYGVWCNRTQVLDLDASTSSKFSRHLIFQSDDIVFENNLTAGNFVRYIFNHLMLYLESERLTSVTAIPSPSGPTKMQLDCGFTSRFEAEGDITKRCPHVFPSICASNNLLGVNNVPENISVCSKKNCSNSNFMSENVSNPLTEIDSFCEPGGHVWTDSCHKCSKECCNSPSSARLKHDTAGDRDVDLYGENSDWFDDSFDEELSYYEEESIKESSFNRELGSKKSIKESSFNRELGSKQEIFIYENSEYTLNATRDETVASVFQDLRFDNFPSPSRHGPVSNFLLEGGDCDWYRRPVLEQGAGRSHTAPEIQKVKQELDTGDNKDSCADKISRCSTTSCSSDQSQKDGCDTRKWAECLAGTCDREVMMRICQKFSVEDLKSLLVHNEDGSTTLFCDTAVYSKNRNFRLYLSSKLNKDNPLVVAEQNLYRPGSSVADRDMLVFYSSLIAIHNHKGTFGAMKSLQFDQRLGSLSASRSKKQIQTDHSRRHKGIQGNGAEQMEGYSCTSPYPEIDQFVNSLVCGEGRGGWVRHWIYFVATETLIYDISGYRWCGNVQREHRSNNIMYVVDLKRGVLYQKCYDPQCQAARYKSEEMELPSSCQPWKVLDNDADLYEASWDGQPVDRNRNIVNIVLDEGSGLMNTCFVHSEDNGQSANSQNTNDCCREVSVVDSLVAESCLDMEEGSPVDRFLVDAVQRAEVELSENILLGYV